MSEEEQAAAVVEDSDEEEEEVDGEEEEEEEEEEGEEEEGEEEHIEEEGEREEWSWRKETVDLLVVCNQRHNYYELFEGAEVNGVPLRVTQAMWDDITMSVYEPTSTRPYGLVCELKAKLRDDAFPGSDQFRRRTFSPDIVLVRNICRGTVSYDYRNILFGFIYSGVPCVNSAFSQYCCLERPIVHGELTRLQQRLGSENFPLILQYYHSYGNDVNFPPEPYPIVAKVSHTHAGYGKMMIESSDRLRDLRSVVSLHKDYATTEQFIESDYELRLQKIGGHYRALKKQLVSYWKSNAFGTAGHEDAIVEPIHKKWLDECSKLFGGLDIFALDVLHGVDDNFYVLELNDTAIGFGPDHIPEDLQAIREVVLARIASDVLREGASSQPTMPRPPMGAPIVEPEEVEEWEVERVNMTNDLMQKEKEVNELTDQVRSLREQVRQLRQQLTQERPRRKFLGIL